MPSCTSANAHVLGLPVPALDVIGGTAIGGAHERVRRIPMLDHATKQHEHALVRGTSGLRHVVRHDQDRVLASQVPDQLLDRLGTLGIEGRAGLVHQQDSRLDRKEPCDAELLLLLQRQLDRWAGQPILDLVPQQHRLQGRCDELVFLLAREGLVRAIVQPIPKQHVVTDRQGQRIRPLEHHADVLAHLHHLDLGGQDVVAEHAHRAAGTHVGQPLHDAVDRAQQRGFSAPRGADHRRDDAFLDLEIDIEERLEIPVPERQLLGLDRVGAVSQSGPPRTRSCGCRSGW